MPGNQHGIRPGGLGGAQTRPQVARILDAVQDDEQWVRQRRPTGLEVRFGRRRKRVPLGGNALVADDIPGVRTPRHCSLEVTVERLPRNALDAHPGRARRRDQQGDLAVARAVGNDQTAYLLWRHVEQRLHAVNAECPINVGWLRIRHDASLFDPDARPPRPPA